MDKPSPQYPPCSNDAPFLIHQLAQYGREDGGPTLPFLDHLYHGALYSTMACYLVDLDWED